MTSRQHQDWINRGKPDSGLALPLQLLANTLAAAGYTVYVYPNDAHLNAEPPEDHTYYAETGWPNTSPKWWRHAIDIMPPPGGRNLPSLQSLGQTIFNARQSGQITWLKYMNWPSDGNLSRAVQDRWEPNHARGSSSDTGHIHLSSVTGVETLDSSFNPLTSVVVVGDPIPSSTSPEDEHMFLAFQGNGFYLCDGMRSRPITLGQIGDLRTLVNEGLVAPVQRLDNPRGGWYEGAFGAIDLTEAPAQAPILLSGAQIDVIATAVTNAVVAAVGNLSDADKPAVLDATRQALLADLDATGAGTSDAAPTTAGAGTTAGA